LGARNAAALYLLGFSAEMILKFAYFRYLGSSLTDPVRGMLPRARRDARRQYGIALADENYHNLLFWALCLRKKRQLDGRLWDNHIDHRFVQALRRLSQIWYVGMRYYPDRTNPREVLTAYSDATWLKKHRLHLWRK